MIWSTNGAPSLAAENLQLKKRVAELESRANSPIAIDPKKGKVEVNDLAIGSLAIEKLELHSDALSGTSEKIGAELANLKLNRFKPADLKQLSREPLTVRALKASIPLPLVNSILDQVAGAELQRAGLSDIRLSQNKDGSLKVVGKSHKGLTLPFEANGRLSTTGDGKIKFQLENSRVGSIPMPGFLVSFATSLAEGKLRKAGVSTDGQEFVIDPNQHKPDNIRFQLDKLSVHDGAILIEAGSPTVSRPSPVPRIPRAASRT